MNFLYCRYWSSTIKYDIELFRWRFEGRASLQFCPDKDHPICTNRSADIKQKSADLIWCKLGDFNQDKTVDYKTYHVGTLDRRKYCLWIGKIGCPIWLFTQKKELNFLQR